MKSVFIAGANSATGRAYVESMAEQGWQVFAGMLPGSQAPKAWEANSHIIVLRCDVTNPVLIGSAKDEVAAYTNETLDLLINNAGASMPCGPVESPSMENARLSMEVNYWGVINLVQAFVPLLRQARGRIINITLPAANKTMPLGFAHSTSRTAAHSLGQHIRAEMKPFGVDVTTVELASVDNQALNESYQGAETWGLVPAHLRESYESEFRFKMENLGSGEELMQPEEASKLLYQQVISEKKFEEKYQLGIRLKKSGFKLFGSGSNESFVRMFKHQAV